MEKLKNKLLGLLLFIIGHIYAQEIKTNMIIIIDNELITQNLNFTLTSSDGLTTNFDYRVGKELIISEDIFKESGASMKFTYFGRSEQKTTKQYDYNIDFKVGWIKNSQYCILRIYNLDKKVFRKAFCQETKNFVIDVQNQNYNMNSLVCKHFLRL